MTTIEINGHRFQVDYEPGDPRIEFAKHECQAWVWAMENLAAKEQQSKPA